METIEKDSMQTENKEPDNNQDSIRRRLRDRDLLKKRKAEAEEKATYQVQSKRQRVTREKSSTGKVGRPQKRDTKARLSAPQEGVPPEATSVAEAPSVAEPSVQQPPAAHLPAPVLTEPQPVAVSLLLEDKPLQPKGSWQVEEVLIEDLGADEKEDNPPLPANLPIDQGSNEELSDKIADQAQLSSTSTFTVSPQEDKLPGSLF